MLQAMSILANIIFPRRRVMTQATIVLVTVLTVFVVEGHSLPYPPHPHPAASLPVSPHKNKDNNNAAFPPALRRLDAETDTHTDDGDARQQHHQSQFVVSDLTAFSQHRLQHQTPHHHQHLHQRQAKSTQSRIKRTSGLGAIKLMGLDNIDFTASTLDKALNADAAQRQTGEGGGRGARTRERTPPSLSPSPASPSSASPVSGRRKLHSSVRLKDLRKMLQQMSEAG